MDDRIRTITYIGYGVFVTFLLVSLIVVFQMGRFEQGIVEIVTGYGYAAILAVSFLADIIMQPIGPDIPLVAGIFIGLSPVGALIFASAGSIAASILGYFLGSVYGEAGFMKFYGYTRYEKWRKMYEKYGKIIVVVAALTPLPYVPICWLSGIFRMKHIEFLIFGIGARILRFMGVAYITVVIMGM